MSLTNRVRATGSSSATSALGRWIGRAFGLARPLANAPTAPWLTTGSCPLGMVSGVGLMFFLNAGRTLRSAASAELVDTPNTKLSPPQMYRHSEKLLNRRCCPTEEAPEIFCRSIPPQEGSG